MYNMLLWNSISPRKRSPSDTFLENGIGILLQNCREAGYNLIVEDWASADFYNSISPKFLTGINRIIYQNILNKGNKTPAFVTKILAFFTLVIQKIIDAYHNIKMNRLLTKLAKKIASLKSYSRNK